MRACEGSVGREGEMIKNNSISLSAGVNNSMEDLLCTSNNKKPVFSIPANKSRATPKKNHPSSRFRSRLHAS